MLNSAQMILGLSFLKSADKQGYPLVTTIVSLKFLMIHLFTFILFSDITVATQTDLEAIIDVVESTRSLSICMNVTDGYLESTNAYIRYSTGSGSARGTIS